MWLSSHLETLGVTTSPPGVAMGFEGWHVWDPGIFAWQNVMTPWVCREGHDGDSWGILVEHWLLAKIIRCYPVEIWRICRNPGAFGGLHLQALSFLIAQSVGAWVGWRPCMCKVVTPPTKSQWVVHPEVGTGVVESKGLEFTQHQGEAAGPRWGKRIDRSYGRSLNPQSCEFWYLVFT